jgi:Zn-dependent peptidase ImmA (M78 family)
MLKIKFVKNVWLKYDFMGVYDYLNNTIRIQKKLSLKDKIDTIIHEFGHYIIYKLNLGKNCDYTYDIICILLDSRYKGRRTRTFKSLTKYYFK